MKGKKIMLSVVILSLLLFLTDVSAVPSIPSFFYGDLTINGEQAPVGTEIVAKIDDEVRGSIITSESGKYGEASGSSKLLVEGERSDDGKTVVFFINGVEGEQTGVWESGEIFNLDLSVEIADNNQQNNQNNDSDDDDEDEDNDDSNGDDNQPIVNLGNIVDDVNGDDDLGDSNVDDEEEADDDEEEQNKIFGFVPMIGLLSFSILVLLLAGVLFIRKTLF